LCALYQSNRRGRRHQGWKMVVGIESQRMWSAPRVNKENRKKIKRIEIINSREVLV
jgi:hypothetical protein